MTTKLPLAARLGGGLLALAAAACQNPSGANAGGGANKTHGEQMFATTCATCHGTDGNGIKGLGKSLVTSDYVKKSSDDQLLDMINEGRDANDPLNTTGVAMPPKGGNASLTDQDLRDVIAYVRTLKPA